MKNRSKWFLWSVAVALSLVTHLAFATIFLSGDEDTKVAGSSVSAISVMGNGDISQILRGELNSNQSEDINDPIEVNEVLNETEKRQVIDERKPDVEQLKNKPVEELLPDVPMGQVLSAATSQIAKENNHPPELVAAKPISNVLELVSDHVSETVVKLNEVSNVNSSEEISSTQPNDRVETKDNTSQDSSVSKQEIVNALEAKDVVRTETASLLPSEIKELSPKQLDQSDEIRPQAEQDVVPVPIMRSEEELKKRREFAALNPKEIVQEVVKPVQQRAPQQKQKVTIPPDSGNKGSGNANTKQGKRDGKNKEGQSASDRQGNSNNAGSANISNYLGKVGRKIKRRFRYSGRNNKRGGIAFTINKNGSISSLRLLLSTGDRKKDQALLNAAKKAAPFPPLPGGKSSLAYGVKF